MRKQQQSPLQNRLDMARTYAYDAASHLLRFEGGRMMPKNCPH